MKLLIEIIQTLFEEESNIILVILVSYFWIKVADSIIKHYKKKQGLKFNEYEDFQKIKQYEEENEQLENELEKTQKKNLIKDTNEEVLDNVQISSIKKDDNSFNADLFKKWSRNIFTYLQLGKEEELKQIRSSISDTFYERKIQMLKDFERDNLELKRENLVIEEIKILDYSKWMDKAQIRVFIKAKLKEYIINNVTQKIIKGNNRRSSERGFILTFQKNDVDQQAGFVTNCPSCGASISNTEFGTCQYCGSLVNPIRYNWKLIKYEVL